MVSNSCFFARIYLVNPGLLSDAVANFELKTVCEVPTGDHVLLAGEVVASHVNAQDLGRLYTLGPGHQLGPCRSAADVSGLP